MQRIERYGVIALALLLVTIAAVSFWDDGGLTKADKKREKPRGQERLAQQEARRKPTTQQNNLPATAKPVRGYSSPRRSTKAPLKSTPRPKSQKGYSTLPATVIAQPEQLGNTRRSDDVAFPDSLKESDPRTRENRNLKQGSPPAPITNYDSIEDRRNTLRGRPEQQQPKPVGQVQQPRVITSTGGTYTVQAGDTLSQISYKTLGTSKRWREIQQLNGNLDPSALYVGAVLKIPSGGTSVASQALPSLSAAQRAPRATDGYYIVRKGDVLSQIAQDELGGASRWREIAALNPSIDPNVLLEGARLRMPSSNAVASRYESSSNTSSTKKKNRVR